MDDGHGGANSASSSLTIANAALMVTSVSISPTSPTTTDAITATVVGSDADGDTLTMTYSWTVDGSPVVGVTSNVLDSSYFVKDQTIEVTVVVSDPTGNQATDSASVISVNSAPSIASVSITPSNPTPQDSLLCGLNS